MNQKEKPNMLSVASVLLIISGVINIIGGVTSFFVVLLFGSMIGIATFGIGFISLCCLIFPIFYIGWGIVEIIYGMKLSKNSYSGGSPYWLAIGEIVIGVVGISSFYGIIVLIIGIINLIIFMNQEVKDYLEG